MPLSFLRKIKHSQPSDVPGRSGDKQAQHQDNSVPSAPIRLKSNCNPHQNPSDPGLPSAEKTQPNSLQSNDYARPVTSGPPVGLADRKHSSNLPNGYRNDKPSDSDGSVETKQTNLSPGREPQVIPTHSVSPRRSAYEEVRDKAIQERPADMIFLIEQNKANTPAELMDWLTETNGNHFTKDKFRRGFDKVKPALSGTMTVVEVGSLFTTFDSSGWATASVGLLKSTLGVAITLAEASEGIQTKINDLIISVPAVDQCDQIASKRNNESIHKTLVRIYEILFEFFFKVTDLLSRGFFITRAMVESDEISSMIEDFSRNSKLLKKVDGLESSEERKVREFLGQGLKPEQAFESSLQLDETPERSFAWIQSEPKVQHWLQDESSRFLVMSGAPGCGKTTTTKYFIQHLRKNQNRWSTGPAMVCFYYCRDEDQRKQARSLFSRLAAQIVEMRPDLQGLVVESLKDLDTKSTIEPSLGNFVAIFENLVQCSGCPIYVVIDALDECTTESQTTILEVFQRIRTMFPFKAFFACRQQEKFKSMIPGQKILSITQTRSLDRDSTIAEYWIKRRPSQSALSIDYRNGIIKKIAQKADGNALWIKLVVNELDFDLSPEYNLQMIDLLPKSLHGIYGRLFEKNKSPLLEPALQFLAVAQRPLALIELQAALRMISAGNRLAGMSVEKLGATIKDFVRVEPSGVMRIFHQSLKELILQRKPSTWPNDRSYEPMEVLDLETTEMEATIHSFVARVCVEHLGSPDFDKNCFDHRTGKKQTEEDVVVALERTNPFLNYAATAWTYHFAECEARKPISQELHNAASKICDPAKQNLRNWIICRSNQVHTELREDLHRLDHLVIASYYHHSSSVTRLLESSTRNHQCSAALYWAFRANHTSAVTKLLTQNHLLRAKDCKALGQTILATATERGDYDFLGKLLRTRLFDNKDINERNFGIKAVVDQRDCNALGRTRFETLSKLGLFRDDKTYPIGKTALMIAASEGHEMIFDMLSHYGADGSIPDSSGRTPIRGALERQRTTIAAKLLSQKNLDLQSSGEYGNVLTLATRQNNLELIQVLLDYRSSYDLSAAPQHLAVADKWGNTPLLYATMNNNLGVAKLILEKASAFRPKPNLCHSDLAGLTPLAWAARLGNEKLLDAILGYTGGRGLEALDLQGHTPLFYAAESGHAACVKLLIERAHANIHHRTSLDETLWIVAAFGGSSDVLRYLKGVPGMDMTSRSRSGNSAVAMAAQGGRTEALQFLVESCGLHADVNRANNDGAAPLGLAIGLGRRDAARQLIKYGADVNASDREGRTALSLAAESGDMGMMEMMLASRALQLDSRDKAHRTALSHAAQAGHVDIVQLLCSRSKRSVNIPDAWGRSPLFYAAAMGHVKVVALLLEKLGAAYERDNEGHTPLDYAVHNDRPHVVSYLRCASLQAPASQPLISLHDLPAPLVDPIWPRHGKMRR
ncbi:ankyrin repeat-containing domain protein [Phyllosticta citricarpa]